MYDFETELTKIQKEQQKIAEHVQKKLTQLIDEAIQLHNDLEIETNNSKFKYRWSTSYLLSRSNKIHTKLNKLNELTSQYEIIESIMSALEDQNDTSNDSNMA